MASSVKQSINIYLINKCNDSLTIIGRVKQTFKQVCTEYDSMDYFKYEKYDTINNFNAKLKIIALLLV